MQRLALRRDERGVTAVMVALLMTSLLSLAAISVDHGAVSFERKRIQNSADAAALAIARDCALGKPTCTTSGAASTASTFTVANAGGGSASIPTVVAPGTGSVEVQISKQAQLGFAQAMGRTSATVNATAKASWNTVPIEGIPILPLGISWCDYRLNNPDSGATPKLIRSDLKLSSRAAKTCTSPTGTGTVTTHEGALWLTNFVGWGNCRYSTGVGVLFNAILTAWGAPFFCDSKIASLTPGQKGLLPVYRELTWTAATGEAKIQIDGFVAVELKSWRFLTWFGFLERKYEDPSLPYCPASESKCEGITPQFVRSVQKDPDFTYGPNPFPGYPLGPVDIKLSD